MFVKARSDTGMGRFIGNSVRCWWQAPVAGNIRLRLVHDETANSPTYADPDQCGNAELRKNAPGKVMVGPIFSKADFLWQEEV